MTSEQKRRLLKATYLATTSGTWSSETDGRSMPNFLRKVAHFIDAPVRSGTPVLTVRCGSPGLPRSSGQRCCCPACWMS